MSQLKLYGRINSVNVLKVVFLLDELEIPFESIPAGGEHGILNEPFFLKLNPFGKVPTIHDVENDYALWESSAILRYLALSRAPAGSSLYPDDPKIRGNIEKWLDFQLGVLVQPITTVFWTYVRLPEEKRDYAAAAKAQEEAEKIWAVVDAEIGDKGYLVTEELTLADVAFAPFVHRWLNLPIERKVWKNVERWYGNLKGHKGAKRVFGPLV